MPSSSKQRTNNNKSQNNKTTTVTITESKSVESKTKESKESTKISKISKSTKTKSTKSTRKKTMDQVEIFFAKDQETWRNWLEENCTKKQAVWLTYHKKKSGKESIKYSEALDEALCFGWIDSTARPHESDPENSYMQYFCKRKEKSQWSKKNKDRVEELINEGKMTEHGLKMINLAKENGMWDLMNDVYEMKLPQDLLDAFDKKGGDAKSNFDNFSASVKKHALGWLFSAKKEETRKKRIERIVEKSSKDEKDI